MKVASKATKKEKAASSMLAVFRDAACCMLHAAWMVASCSKVASQQQHAAWMVGCNHPAAKLHPKKSNNSNSNSNKHCRAEREGKQIAAKQSEKEAEKRKRREEKKRHTAEFWMKKQEVMQRCYEAEQKFKKSEINLKKCAAKHEACSFPAPDACSSNSAKQSREKAECCMDATSAGSNGSNGSNESNGCNWKQKMHEKLK